jgi:[ribosomal protein S5]-alanine N-acetyltransferase
VIKGTSVSLRPVAEADLEELHRRSMDLEARGPWYPLPRTSLTKFRGSFAGDGWWSPDDGIFVVVDEQDQLLGMVVWQKLNGFAMPDVELGHIVFEGANRGKGIATAAVDLLAGWLFDSQAMNRLSLSVHVDNIGSRRVAEKCGFTKEATAREAWYHKGKWHDLDVYTLTRAESDERRTGR